MRKKGLSRHRKELFFGGGAIPLPLASSVVLSESLGVFSLEYIYSQPDSVIEAHRPPEMDLLTISGTVQEDETLTATASGFVSYTGRAAGTHTYAWYKADDVQGTNKTLLGTGTTYTLLTADVGKYVWVEMVVKEVGGSVDGSTTSVFSTVVLAAIAPNFVAGIVKTEEPSQIDVVLNGDITTLTDMTGWSVTTGGSANAITGFSYNDNTLRIALTSAVTVGQAVLLSYDSGVGSLEVGGVAGGSFTDSVCDNRVDASYATKVQWNNNYWGGGANISGNWTNYTGDPSIIGTLNSALIDSGGTPTAIAIAQDVYFGTANNLDDTATTNFPTTTGAAQSGFGVFSNSNNTDLITYTLSGFSANAWVRVRILHGVKNTAFEHEAYMKFVGDFTIQDRIDNGTPAVAFETVHELQADGSGEIEFTYGSDGWPAQNEAHWAALILEF